MLDQEAENLDIKTLEYYMTGRKIDKSAVSYSEPGKKSSPLLKVENLKLSPYFSNVTFELKNNEVLGITGLLGSGRTELALSLFGALPAESGEIRMESKPVIINTIQDAMRHGIGYVPEDRIKEGLFLEQSISNNIIVRIIDFLASKIGIVRNQTNQEIAKIGLIS